MNTYDSDYYNAALHRANAPGALMRPLPSNHGGPVQEMVTPYSAVNVPEPISLVLDNQTAGTKTYVIGDPNGTISEAGGVSASNPDSGTIAPEIIARTLASSPIVIGQINYQVAVSESQFSKKFWEAFADIDGKYLIQPLNIAAAKRNNQFNEKLLTLNVHIALTQFRCLFLEVGAGETVTLTLTPIAASDRN
jgi:hypothetical protein